MIAKKKALKNKGLRSFFFASFFAKKHNFANNLQTKKDIFQCFATILFAVLFARINYLAN